MARMKPTPTVIVKELEISTFRRLETPRVPWTAKVPEMELRAL